MSKMKDSKRFCVVCRKVRTFVYNKAIDHSECFECGGRWGATPK